MSLPLITAASKSGEIVNLILTLGGGALIAQALSIIQWNLEHLSIDSSTGQFKLRKISTAETSNIGDKNVTPIAPPLLSTAFRLTDAAADTAEAALQLAQSLLNAAGNPADIVGNTASNLSAGIGGVGGLVLGADKGVVDKLVAGVASLAPGLIPPLTPGERASFTTAELKVFAKADTVQRKKVAKLTAILDDPRSSPVDIILARKGILP